MNNTSQEIPPAAQHQGDLTASDPYRILGVPSTASQVEIKRAYFALIRQYPPESDAASFKIIRGAYEKLKNLKLRAETDIFLPQPPPAWTPSQTKLSLDTSFHPDDLQLVLRRWGELGQTDFKKDFKEIDL